MTPTVGIQIPFLLAFWLLIRKFFPKWDFSIVIATAWTLLTNVATVPFFYYLFLQTGRLLLGRWERLNGFETFQEKLALTSGEQADWLSSLINNTQFLIENFGLPILLGCLPWALVSAWFGYYGTIRLVKYIRLAKTTKSASNTGSAV